MSKYTTGEMAKLCNISVRAVQFYDTKGVLHPTDLTEGGRRLYTDDDLTKLRLICVLKAIGLSLDSIKGILESESSGKVLSVLLDEQTKQLSDEIVERQNQLDTIKIIKECIRDKTNIPVNSIIDIEHMMENKKGLRKVHGVLIAGGVSVQAVMLSTIFLWISKGVWIPFAAWTPVHLAICFMLIKMLHRNTKYICPECNEEFRPLLKKFMFTSGNKTRLLTCTQCGHKGYCVEVYAK